MAGRTEVQAAACDAVAHEVPNPDEGPVLVDAAFVGDPGTATYNCRLTHCAFVWWQTQSDIVV